MAREAFTDGREQFRVPYGPDGSKGPVSTLDLSEGRRVRITQGPYAGDESLEQEQRNEGSDGQAAPIERSASADDQELQRALELSRVGGLLVPR